MRPNFAADCDFENFFARPGELVRVLRQGGSRRRLFRVGQVVSFLPYAQFLALFSCWYNKMPLRKSGAIRLDRMARLYTSGLECVLRPIRERGKVLI